VWGKLYQSAQASLRRREAALAAEARRCHERDQLLPAECTFRPAITPAAQNLYRNCGGGGDVVSRLHKADGSRARSASASIFAVAPSNRRGPAPPAAMDGAAATSQTPKRTVAPLIERAPPASLGGPPEPEPPTHRFEI
jgi:hypothetical protein